MRLRLGSVEVVHTFLVVPRDDSFFHVYDGILGLDLLKSLGAIIDLPSRRLSLNNNSVVISLDSGVEDCGVVSTGITNGCGPDQPITRNFVGNDAEFWRVMNASEQELPPLSEVLVNCRMVGLRDIPVPREVLVEPRELDVQGIRAVSYTHLDVYKRQVYILNNILLIAKITCFHY